MTPDCSTCRFAEPAVGDDELLRLDCHRYPPQVFEGAPLNGEGTALQARPTVGAGDWCGEYVAKPEVDG